jgi:hypothetical protein
MQLTEQEVRRLAAESPSAAAQIVAAGVLLDELESLPRTRTPAHVRQTAEEVNVRLLILGMFVTGVGNVLRLSGAALTAIGIAVVSGGRWIMRRSHAIH